jgi:hypothetical protein
MTQSTSEVQGAESAISPAPTTSGGRLLVDHLSPKLVAVLTVLGFGLPVIGYFWFLEHYSVNTIIGDQWDDVNIIKQSYVHFFDWGPMWAQHYENRIFFPNIIVVLLAHTVHFNIRVEENFGAVMLVVATGFIIWTHKRRSPSTPWLYYCPAAILALSVVQYGNTIWGFQLAWYMVLLSLATAVLLLDRVNLTWITLVGALAAAVVGSFSSLQGLLIWPAGLVLLYFRRRPLPQLGIWIAVAAASTVLYFRGYNSSESPLQQYARHHLLASLKFFLFAIGDVVGKPVGLGTSSPDNNFVILFGVVIVVLALSTIVICGLRRDEGSGSPVGVALICFGLLFAALVTQGRAFLGLGGASFSRYTTFDILILIGIYLALLGRRPRPVDEGQLQTSPSGSLPSNPDGNSRSARRWLDRVALPCARIVLLVAIVIQIPFGIYHGVQGGRNQYVFDVKAASVLRNIDHAPNGEVSFYLFFLESPASVRERARVLEEHHLSLFANG